MSSSIFANASVARFIRIAFSLPDSVFLNDWLFMLSEQSRINTIDDRFDLSPSKVTLGGPYRYGSYSTRWPPCARRRNSADSSRPRKYTAARSDGPTAEAPSINA